MRQTKVHKFKIEPTTIPKSKPKDNTFWVFYNINIIYILRIPIFAYGKSRKKNRTIIFRRVQVD